MAVLIFFAIFMMALFVALPFFAFGLALLMKTFFFCAASFVIGYLFGKMSR